MEIRLMCADGRPANTIPLNDGYFEMRLPRELLNDNPKTIKIH